MHSGCVLYWRDPNARALFMQSDKTRMLSVIQKTVFGWDGLLCRVPFLSFWSLELKRNKGRNHEVRLNGYAIGMVSSEMCFCFKCKYLYKVSECQSGEWRHVHRWSHFCWIGNRWIQALARQVPRKGLSWTLNIFELLRLGPRVVTPGSNKTVGINANLSIGTIVCQRDGIMRSNPIPLLHPASG